MSSIAVRTHFQPILGVVCCDKKVCLFGVASASSRIQNLAQSLSDSASWKLERQPPKQSKIAAVM